ncbi:hypothetical protein ACFXPI_02205 [Streptomyces sp. NPDC059104]|uniref:hypothetical protein n=1 Tax=Streptomyces sp. NPDC059104 TaxID=3346729 RepID=UPI003699FBE9
MRKIIGVAAAVAAAAAITAGTATLAQAQTGGAKTPDTAGKSAPALAESASFGKETAVRSDGQRVVTNVFNRSGEGMSLLEFSTLDSAAFSSDGGHRLPKTGDTVANGSPYSYLNVVKFPDAAMKTTTTWKIGDGATVKLSQDSTETALQCDISGPKAGEYNCASSIGSGSGNGTDVTDVVISKR